jgi:hypothetical protein
MGRYNFSTTDGDISMVLEDIDDGYCMAGRSMKWWERWMPHWGWCILATWSNGRGVTKLIDYETCLDAGIHREILNNLTYWLGTDQLTREEKVDLMHTIRDKLKLPNIRNIPTHVRYCGPED